MSPDSGAATDEDVTWRDLIKFLIRRRDLYLARTQIDETRMIST